MSLLKRKLNRTIAKEMGYKVRKMPFVDGMGGSPCVYRDWWSRNGRGEEPPDFAGDSGAVIDAAMEIGKDFYADFCYNVLDWERENYDPFPTTVIVAQIFLTTLTRHNQMIKDLEAYAKRNHAKRTKAGRN